MSIFRFIIIWGSQTLSQIGSGITSFVFGLWVYLQTQSTIQFGIVAFLSHVPSVVLAPFAGVITDYWDRKKIMFICDVGSALIMLCVTFLSFSNLLSLGHIYLFASLISILSTFHSLAYISSTSLMVPSQFYGRANGMLQMGTACTRFISPLFAGFLLDILDLGGIAILDFISFSVAAIVLLFINVPQTSQNYSHANATSKIVLFFKQQKYGLEYHKNNEAFKILLIFFMLINFISATFFILLTPLLLSSSSKGIAAAVASAAGAGTLLGSIFMSVWDSQKNRIYGIIHGSSLMGIFMILLGLQVSTYGYFFIAFTFSFFVPIVYGCCQTIYQAKVNPDCQGRIFGFRRMVYSLFLIMGYILTPILCDFFQKLIYLLAPYSYNKMLLGAKIHTTFGMRACLILFGLITIFISRRILKHETVINMEDFYQDWESIKIVKGSII